MLKGIRQIWQRARATMPTFFQRLFFAAITIFGAPWIIEFVTGLLNESQHLPAWINAEWLKTFRLICLGMAVTAKLTISYRKTPPSAIPDINHPIDAIINVSPTGKATIEPLKE